MASSDTTGVARQAADRQRELDTLDRLAQRFGHSLTGALNASASSGKQLDSVLGSIGARLQSALATNLASGLQTTLQSGLEQALQSVTGGLTLGWGALPFAEGGVIAAGRVQPFASGGVVTAPTYFPMAGGLGLMGEAGPEAVLPLARGPDGRLGVRAGTGAVGATQVNVTIQAADLVSFKRSETQVAAALARAVARGRRAT